MGAAEVSGFWWFILQMVRLRGRCSCHNIASKEHNTISSIHGLQLHWPASLPTLKVFASVLSSSANQSLSSTEVLLPQGSDLLLPPPRKRSPISGSSHLLLLSLKIISSITLLFPFWLPLSPSD